MKDGNTVYIVQAKRKLLLLNILNNVKEIGGFLEVFFFMVTVILR